MIDVGGIIIKIDKLIWFIKKCDTENRYSIPTLEDWKVDIREDYHRDSLESRMKVMNEAWSMLIKKYREGIRT